jgi:hypothetical protein
MGPKHGGLLELAMGSMPNVVWELPSKVDVNRTFYESANRNAKATSSACELTNLGHVLLEDNYFTEDGFPLGTCTDQNMFCVLVLCGCSQHDWNMFYLDAGLMLRCMS